MSKELEKIPGMPPVEEKLDTTEEAVETGDSAAEDLVRQSQAEEEMKAAVQNALAQENQTPGKIKEVSNEIKNIDNKSEAKPEAKQEKSTANKLEMINDFFNYAEDRLNELKTKNIFARSLMSKNEIDGMISTVNIFRSNALQKGAQAISWQAMLDKLPAINDKKSLQKINELEALHQFTEEDKDKFKDADAQMKWSGSHHNFGSGE